MKAIIAVLSLTLVVAILLFVPTLAAPFESVYGPVTLASCATALGLCAISALVVGVVIRRSREHGSYLVKLFMLALILRIAVGVAIFVFNGQDFFGGDAWTYDYFGYHQLLAWRGDKYASLLIDQYMGRGLGSGWGMLYLVAGIYSFVGRNMLAIQFFNAVIGAATVPLIFMSSYDLFRNFRVARIAAFAVAFYPSLVLWSSQGLKDPIIVFALALSIFAAGRLRQKFSVIYLASLLAGLAMILAFRFYVFYMLIAAIAGGLLIAMRAMTAQNVFRQCVIILLIGISLTYVGVTRYASVQFEQSVTFDQLRRSRLDAATSAQSGFGKDVDVSTARGALSTIPLGLVYLFFAPFPWQLGSLRQTLTLPEMVIWWGSFPLLILGLWFSIRYRFRQIFTILLFTSMLSVAYSVFQGNVGTAYRQRSQLLVFYFIFVAVGFILLKEKSEQRARRRLWAKRSWMADEARRHLGRPAPEISAPGT